MLHTHESYMRLAIAEALRGMLAGEGGPFGAAVVAPDGELLSLSCNKVLLLNDPTAHAEVMAIRQACGKLGNFQLKDCILYTSCEPCPMCLGAIYWARPAVVYYANTRKDAAAIGFDDHFIYEELEKHFSARHIPMMQTLRDEAMEPFRLWAASDHKTLY